MWWPPPAAGIWDPAPITKGAVDLPDWYYVGLVIVVGGFWLTAYVLAIKVARETGYNGIPVIAAALNISWEFNDSFIVDHASWQKPFNFVWFLLDIVIVTQIIRYGNKDYSHQSRRQFKQMFFGTLVFALIFIPAFEIEINDFYGAYTGLGLNCIMSLLFIHMLRTRKSTAGQSMYVALSKQIGSLLAVLMSVSLYPHSLLIPVMCATLVIFDFYYTRALYQQYRKDGLNPWAAPWKKHPLAVADTTPAVGRPLSGATP